MIVGLEGIHESNGIEMNKLGTWPRVFLERIPGLRDLPELIVVEDKLIGRVGVAPRASDRDGKVLTYEGQIQARTLGDLITYAEDVAHAFAGNSEQLFTAKPADDYAGAFALPTRWFYGRPSSCQINTEYPDSMRGPTKGYEAAFSMVVRLSDPRYYWPDPITIAAAAAIDADNPGRADTEAVITIEGAAMTDVTITNTSIDKQIVLAGIDPAVDTIVIDSKRRTIKRGSGDNLYEFYDPLNSTWWDRGIPFLQSGLNHLTKAGAGVATIAAEFYPADYS